MVCRNPDQARKDAATRAQILAALKSKLRNDGPKSVGAIKGYKRYLKAEKGAFAVDLDKARDEQRFDGMWVLRTNTELTAVEIALRYKQLWMVEQIYRTAKSLCYSTDAARYAVIQRDRRMHPFAIPPRGVSKNAT